uniref:CRP/FNR family transcriptional regulator, anaerobic regulatory protein n=2 Tax=unclassified Candidatus Kentrum TaxID=2643149 RepID=A0A451ALV8_9GAMM|nr:MAG: CRP/FNR family transcriptional regulator, anaerobic regulatory protein [Candidatus Kentron sp. LPFa]VFK17368.1 MAG: CRP/FNR family transcriptional regulator, anaerobic regulatory protein [Candidatus Kentron sp. LPFa]VFK31992.1 MAG: CRP/FNR family transcriptional regulator, anaerobic regulatory protein [Candidatus Kentron sp. LPFa]VFK67002.1 MAG: CRP/FNR family transcriptional regulator, anaerobic regulatory protein [Candidatus Kentron sp. UNK]VFK72442.1 MAG: CRP/FNR family transcription
MNRNIAPEFVDYQISCRNCCMANVCLPLGLSAIELDQLMKIIARHSPISRGEHLFEAGDIHKSLYAVRSGSIKVYIPTESGEEQVHRFILPGELLGFDAIEGEKHTCAAVALETTSVCELPYRHLEKLCHNFQGLDHEIHRLFGKEISNEYDLLQLLAKKSAEVRLATFLLDLSDRLKKRGFSEREFNLSMSRHDISNYLGLAVETVSRLFARFQNDGLLKVKRRNIQLTNMTKLKELLTGAPPLPKSVPAGKHRDLANKGHKKALHRHRKVGAA